MARGRSEEFKTPPCRLLYTDALFKARAVEQGQKPKFGCTLVFPVSTPREALEKACAEAMEQEWPGKWGQMLKAGLIRTPFLKGDGKEAHNKTTGQLKPGMGADVFFIRVQANEDSPPHVRFRSKNMQATKQEVYSGCYGFAVIQAFAWDNPSGGKGVSFGVNYVQKTSEGEPIGGGARTDPEKWHEKIADEGVAPETKGGAGAAGLFG